MKTDDPGVYTGQTELSPETATKLVHQLQLRGIAAEYSACAKAAGGPWHVTMRPSYFDRDEKQSREYDLWFSHPENRAQGKAREILTSLDLACEVKVARDTPWFVLRPPPDPGSPPLPFHPVAAGSLGAAVLNRAERLLRECGHPQFHPNPLQRPRRLQIDAGLAQLGKGREPCFDACCTAVKAAEHLQNMYATGDGQRQLVNCAGSDQYGVVHLIVPLIVVDGLLLVVESQPTGQLGLTKTDGAQIEFGLRTDQYSRAQYRVDVVTMEGLPRYLAIMERLAEQLPRSADEWFAEIDRSSTK